MKVSGLGLLVLILVSPSCKKHGGGGGGGPATGGSAPVLHVDPANLGVLAPGAAVPPVTFTVTDGSGSPSPHNGSLNWTLTNLDTGASAESGTAPFNGTDTATVTLTPITTAALYRLTGQLDDTPLEQSVALAVLTLRDSPGPFVALKSGRAGEPYQDDVSFAVPGATAWGLASGTLPDGIVQDSSAAAFSGTPTSSGSSAFTLYARTSASEARHVRCALTVLPADGPDGVPGQSFTASGPAPVQTSTDSFTFTSSFDATSYATQLKIYHPALSSIAAPAPLFVFHRGRGFHYLDYDLILNRIAAYGFVCASVEDFQSFLSPTSPSPSSFYDATRRDCGMLSASGFQEATLDRMLARSGTAGDAFEGKLDPNRVFVGGHSRGGGATHGSHVRSLRLKIRGVVYFMLYDLRRDSQTQPPAVSPAYDIPTDLPRLPFLTLMAENDGDLIYPWTDQLIDRARGPATSVTVYGACHNYTGDVNSVEGGSSPYITRQQQQDVLVTFTVAFLKRWADLDSSLEGFLYGDEWVGSSVAGVTGNRNGAVRVLVDDFQDADAATNSRGGANSFTGGSRQEASVYPALTGSNFGSLKLRHNILTFNAASAAYTAGFAATDLSSCRRLLWRCGQTSSQGYGWLTLKVRLKDSGGATATVTIFDSAAPSATYLPRYVSGNPRVYDRFVDCHVKLGTFATATPGLDLTRVVSVEFLYQFSGVPSASQQFYMDDVRFE